MVQTSLAAEKRTQKFEERVGVVGRSGPSTEEGINPEEMFVNVPDETRSHRIGRKKQCSAQ
jgi:hypothetical protein